MREKRRGYVASTITEYTCGGCSTGWLFFTYLLNVNPQRKPIIEQSITIIHLFLSMLISPFILFIKECVINANKNEEAVFPQPQCFRSL